MNSENGQPANPVIRPCSGTTRGQIEQLQAQGLDLDAISRMTGALTGCGSCEWDIGALLETIAVRHNSSA